MNSERYKKACNRVYDRYGAFEFPNVKGTTEGSISLLDTNSNDRPEDRVGVDSSGEVFGIRCLMYKRSFLDSPVSLGLSSWMSNNP